MLANLRQSNPQALGLLVRGLRLIAFLCYIVTTIICQIRLDELLNSDHAPALSVRDQVILSLMLLSYFNMTHSQTLQHP